MPYNMWGETPVNQEQTRNEDFNLTDKQRLAKYTKPIVCFDREGVLFEYKEAITSREEAIPIKSSFEAIGLIRRKGYKIAMIHDQPGVSKNLVTHEQVEDINAYVIELLGESNCPSIDCILYNESNEKFDYYGKPNNGMFLRMRDEFGVPFKNGYYIGHEYLDIKTAKKSQLKPVAFRFSPEDLKKLNSFAMKDIKRKTKLVDDLMDFAHSLP